MNYPTRFIRGIPNKSFLVEERTVGSQLYHFKREHVRDDGLIEESINWEDDSFAVKFSLKQRIEKSGKRELQFKAGVAIIDREDIDSLKNQVSVRGRLSYERQRLENNPYHGNLLLDKAIPTAIMKMIAAGLALVSRVIPREMMIVE
jgi:hypothetical protein